jgi:hypothetical protein
MSNDAEVIINMHETYYAKPPQRPSRATKNMTTGMDWSEALGRIPNADSSARNERMNP